MARMSVLACVAVVAGLAVGPVEADQIPILRAATIQRHHLAIRVSVSDLRPVQVIAATSRAENARGALLGTNVRLRETVKLASSATGVVRWQSQETLPRGIYFVQVEAIDQSGVTDCLHVARNCLEHWSNVRRVVVG